jgi:hypothetical protein
MESWHPFAEIAPLIESFGIDTNAKWPSEL